MKIKKSYIIICAVICVLALIVHNNEEEKKHQSTTVYHPKEDFESLKLYLGAFKKWEAEEYYKNIIASGDSVFINFANNFLNDKIKAYEDEKNNINIYTKGLKKSHDEMTGRNWYKNSFFTHYNNRNLISLYIGELDDYFFLRMKMSYKGDDWIFFKQAYISFDGNPYEISFRLTDKQSDNTTVVWEWIDISVDDALLQYLLNNIDKPRAKISLRGKYNSDRSISQIEIKALKQVLKSYVSLTTQNRTQKEAEIASYILEK